MIGFMCFVAGFSFAYAACREAKLGIIKLPGIEPSPDKVRELEEKINKQSKQVEKLLKLVVEMAKKPTPEPTAPKAEAKQGQEVSEAGTSQTPAKKAKS